MQCNMLEYARVGTRIEPHQLRLIWLCFLSHSHLHLKYVYDFWTSSGSRDGNQWSVLAVPITELEN